MIKKHSALLMLIEQLTVSDKEFNDFINKSNWLKGEVK